MWMSVPLFLSITIAAFLFERRRVTEKLWTTSKSSWTDKAAEVLGNNFQCFVCCKWQTAYGEQYEEWNGNVTNLLGCEKMSQTGTLTFWRALSFSSNLALAANRFSWASSKSFSSCCIFFCRARTSSSDFDGKENFALLQFLGFLLMFLVVAELWWNCQVIDVYLFGAEIGIAGLLFASISTVHSDVLLGLHGLHFLLDRVHFMCWIGLVVFEVKRSTAERRIHTISESASTNKQTEMWLYSPNKQCNISWLEFRDVVLKSIQIRSSKRVRSPCQF